jgi:hypothetical protein
MPDYTMRTRAPTASLLGRRHVIVASTAALAGSVLATPAVQAADEREDRERGRRPVPPAPQPIPGGIQIGPAPTDVIHVWAAGLEGVGLPYTGGTLQGLDYDSNTIYSFEGNVAVAYHIGTAVGGDGTRYDLETDLRAFEGTYIAQNGSRHQGAFAFI